MNSDAAAAVCGLWRFTNVVCFLPKRKVTSRLYTGGLFFAVSTYFSANFKDWKTRVHHVWTALRRNDMWPASEFAWVRDPRTNRREAMDYTNWNAAEPTRGIRGVKSECCVEMWYFPAAEAACAGFVTWNDERCFWPYPFLCELNT